MAEEQKSNLLKQSKLAHEINEKQGYLEKTKKEYEDIVSQVNIEKSKLVECEKLKKLIASQEKDLVKAQKERLKINQIISKEKENIAKKTKEEQAKLKQQSILAKQLASEKKNLEKIKLERKKVEEKIKKSKPAKKTRASSKKAKAKPANSEPKIAKSTENTDST